MLYLKVKPELLKRHCNGESTILKIITHHHVLTAIYLTTIEQLVLVLMLKLPQSFSQTKFQKKFSFPAIPRKITQVYFVFIK